MGQASVSRQLPYFYLWGSDSFTTYVTGDPLRICWYETYITRVNRLLVSADNIIQRSFILTRYACDGQTDRHADRIAVAKTVLSIAARCKNHINKAISYTCQCGQRCIETSPS